MNRSTAKLIATFGYSGLLKPASGTWGTLAALPVGWLLHVIGGPIALTGATILAYLIGLKATEIYTMGSDNHDPSEVVIDEVVGMWIALFPVSFGARIMGADILQLYPGWIVAFLAFRFFDITKFGPIGKADRRGDAKGVMLDDVYAGIAAAITVILAAYIAHMVIIGPTPMRF
ncbi:phosphatidylglycerophosphatase A [Aliiroseovarius crassostreae]|uniref:phosphatidylglycerophosphatase A family protein n=1 Tax=Aliiroseovarius crassostreae TaxID=154981 RepID=UPI0021FE62D7|nr:phosphatidylglycerophosphatase A [Aliiroseovarius crassostreae]UWP90267.1 phosphatidylglycerophosphatase A [Aliiroseovarius crassostreae]UWP93410.1 phosphatidylglycerophosphatase A [Aliiroseovarius crassostreae]UWP99715.1 phosphatidylglycerophosphatase A [Aliiroseovarius crassostreae]UWQ06043.1 phosphatidylglycerophosphatase A [Aliiroseovarius crassostreae]UWQ12259.1 phosphatidylglycerophosphatase A [Aliiroseovarius crassostreae]